MAEEGSPDMGRASRQAHLLPQRREDSHSCARAAGVIVPAWQVRSPGSMARAGAATSGEGAGPRPGVAAARHHGRQDARRAPAHFIGFYRAFHRRWRPHANNDGPCRQRPWRMSEPSNRGSPRLPDQDERTRLFHVLDAIQFRCSRAARFRPVDFARYRAESADAIIILRSATQELFIAMP